MTPKPTTQPKQRRPTPGKKITAATLIEEAATRRKVALAPEAAIVELRKLVEHNDAQSGRLHRAGWQMAKALLQSYGWDGESFAAVNRVCREQLGRTSYASP